MLGNTTPVMSSSNRSTPRSSLQLNGKSRCESTTSLKSPVSRSAIDLRYGFNSLEAKRRAQAIATGLLWSRRTDGETDEIRRSPLGVGQTSPLSIPSQADVLQTTQSLPPTQSIIGYPLKRENSDDFNRWFNDISVRNRHISELSSSPPDRHQ